MALHIYKLTAVPFETPIKIVANCRRKVKEMIVYEDHIEIKMLIGEDMQTPICDHSIKNERPDPKVEALGTNDLCLGSTSHQRWLLGLV